jgi:hypothetical protein
MGSMRASDSENIEEGHMHVLARKVDNSTFVWAIGLLSSFLFALGLWCFNSVAGVRQDVTASNVAIAATSSRLSVLVDQNNASAQIMQLQLGKIQTDLEWIKRQLDDAKAKR